MSRQAVAIRRNTLTPRLQEVWDAAEPGEDRVLPMMRGKSVTWIRKPLIRAIRGAGLMPWDKLCTSLRATRDTELRETYPGHVVEAWIGHSAAIARKNYLQVTDEHFERGRQKKALQKALQHPAASASTASQTKTATPPKPLELPSNAAQCDAVQEQRVGVTGFEPVTSCMSKTADMSV